MTLMNYLKRWWYADRLLRLTRMQQYEEARGNETAVLDKAINDTKKRLEEL